MRDYNGNFKELHASQEDVSPPKHGSYREFQGVLARNKDGGFERYVTLQAEIQALLVETSENFREGEFPDNLDQRAEQLFNEILKSKCLKESELLNNLLKGLYDIINEHVVKDIDESQEVSEKSSKKLKCIWPLFKMLREKSSDESCCWLTENDRRKYKLSRREFHVGAAVPLVHSLKEDHGNRALHVQIVYFLVRETYVGVVAGAIEALNAKHFSDLAEARFQEILKKDPQTAINAFNEFKRELANIISKFREPSAVDQTQDEFIQSLKFLEKDSTWSDLYAGTIPTLHVDINKATLKRNLEKLFYDNVANYLEAARGTIENLESLHQILQLGIRGGHVDFSAEKAYGDFFERAKEAVCNVFTSMPDSGLEKNSGSSSSLTSFFLPAKKSNCEWLEQLDGATTIPALLDLIRRAKSKKSIMFSKNPEYVGQLKQIEEKLRPLIEVEAVYPERVKTIEKGAELREEEEQEALSRGEVMEASSEESTQNELKFYEWCRELVASECAVDEYAAETMLGLTDGHDAVCPVLHQIMDNPVFLHVTSDDPEAVGSTVDRKTAAKFAREKRELDPLTNCKLTGTSQRNQDRKELVAKFMEAAEVIFAIKMAESVVEKPENEDYAPSAPPEDLVDPTHAPSAPPIGIGEQGLFAPLPALSASPKSDALAQLAGLQVASTALVVGVQKKVIESPGFNL